MKDGTDPLSRICTKQQETIDHLISGCPELAKVEYSQRHDKVAYDIHCGICWQYNIEVNANYYEHVP